MALVEVIDILRNVTPCGPCLHAILSVMLVSSTIKLYFLR